MHFFKKIVDFLFDTKMPWFVRTIFHNIFGYVDHNLVKCASKFYLAENENIVEFVEESNFDLIIGDPFEIRRPLLSWEYDIPLSFNTRWALFGDAGEILTGKLALNRY